MDSKTWAMILHLSVFAGYVIPFAGLIAPIVIWQIKKAEFPELDAHGKEVTNFLISMIVYSMVAGLLVLVFVGIFLLMALAVMGIVFPIIGAINASSGKFWRYPLIFRVIS